MSAYDGPRTSKYKLWHIPQIPGQPIVIEFEYVADAVMVSDILADYDQFQLDTNIKPDYSNASGIMVWNEEDGSYEDVDDDLEGEIILEQLHTRWKVQRWQASQPS